MCKGSTEQNYCVLENFHIFHQHNRHISLEYQNLYLATTAAIIFEFQKKDVRDDTISHQRSGVTLSNCERCPVWVAWEIILQLWKYNIPPAKFADTPINYVKLEGRSFTIPSSIILIRLRQVVSSLGPNRLGFTADEIGTHSNRSGGAMGMFLAGTPVYTFMLMGRWSSDTFMRYIRKQVLSLSHGISAKMLSTKNSLWYLISYTLLLMEICKDAAIQVLLPLQTLMAHTGIGVEASIQHSILVTNSN